MTAPTVLAHDVFVRPKSPVAAALGCLLTIGVLGAVSHHRANDELGRYGRRRGQMPFAFLPVSTGASTTGWVVGLLAWFLVAAALLGYAIGLVDGHRPGFADVTTFASLALLLAPLVLVTAATLRRIRTAQHMAGIDGPWPSPVRGALLAALFPPLGTWHVQRELNRIWQAYS